MRPIRSSHPARHRLLAVLVLLIVLATAACSGSDTADDSTGGESTDEAAQDTSGSMATDDATAATAVDGRERLEADDAALGVGLAADAEAPAAATAAEPAEAEDAASADVPIPPLQTAATGERIIKEGTVSIEVDPGDFDAAFGQVIARAQELGGHVAGTSSSTDPAPATSPTDTESLTSGQVTIRSPVRNFEDLLTSIGDSGEIIDRNITSQDVTAEYTDLESRRRNLQAQERFYLGLLEQATTVPDAIAVQQQLDAIQGQIEQITGRLNLLDDRTAFSTLTVRIAERGAAPVAEEVVEEPGGLTPYIQDAVDTLIATVGSLIVFLTFLSPFLLLAGLGYAVYRTLRRGRTSRHQTQHGAPAAHPAGADAEAATTGPVPVGVGAAEDDGPR